MTQKEKESYLQAMLYVARIDGERDAEESESIRKFAQKLKLENADQKIRHLSKELCEGKELRDVLSGIQDRNKKLILIYELVLLACVDGHYSSEENDALRRICAILYVEFEKLREIRDLVKEYCEFRRRAEYVLERKVVLQQILQELKQ